MTSSVEVDEDCDRVWLLCYHLCKCADHLIPATLTYGCHGSMIPSFAPLVVAAFQSQLHLSPGA